MTKRLSLYGVKLEDALRVALSTPIPPGQEKPKAARKKKATVKKKAAIKKPRN